MHRIDEATAPKLEIENDIDYLENQMRPNNLRIDVVMQRTAKPWADTEAAVRKTFATSLKLSERHANEIRKKQAETTTWVSRRPSEDLHCEV